MLILITCLLVASDPSDKEKLQGTWEVIRVEQAGQKVPESAPIYKRIYVFNGDKTFVRGEEGNRQSEAKYRLDSSKTPKEIDLLVPDATLKGIYEIEGDELKLHIGGPAGDEDRPNDFSTRSGSRSRLVVYRRVKS